MRLKDTQIRHLPLPEKPRKLFDGGGLYLYLTPSGKYWRYRYRFFGKNRTLALGVSGREPERGAQDAYGGEIVAG